MKTKPAFRRLIAWSLACMLAIVLLTPAPSRAEPVDTTFTVTTYLDYDPGPVNGICYNGVLEGCGLREALKEANALGGNKIINFSPSLAGQTIVLNGAAAWGGSLYLIADHITVEGATSGGDILIDGGGLSANSNLLEIEGNYDYIDQLMLQGWPDVRSPDADHGHGVRIHDPSGSGNASHNTLSALRIYGFEHDGILISGDAGGGGGNNTISYSLIGAANWLSTSCSLGNRGAGIVISSGADNTLVLNGSIVCNAGNGIFLSGQIAGTSIQTNKIGTNGDAAMSNGANGIEDWNASATGIYYNLISANGADGVWLNGSMNASLLGNHIGTDQGWQTALPNANAGVELSNNASGNTIGSSTDASAGNTISGNGGCGVDLNSGAHDNNLNGNYIGIGGSDGMADVANGAAGVCFNMAVNNALSSASAVTPQFISGNNREGVYATHSNRVIIGPQTQIGLAGDGSAALGNARQGILLDADTTGSIIIPAKVMYNGLAGIAVAGNGSTGNELRPAQIRANGGLPIDLGNDDVTPNGAQTPPGPNNWMNYPEVSALSAGVFTASTCPGCIVYVYRAIVDPTSWEGGGVTLSYFHADAATGGFSYHFPAGVSAISMVACDAVTFDCSEMSPSVTDPSPPWLKTFVPLAASR